MVYVTILYLFIVRAILHYKYRRFNT